MHKKQIELIPIKIKLTAKNLNRRFAYVSHICKDYTLFSSTMTCTSIYPLIHIGFPIGKKTNMYLFLNLIQNNLIWISCSSVGINSIMNVFSFFWNFTISFQYNINFDIIIDSCKSCLLFRFYHHIKNKEQISIFINTYFKTELKSFQTFLEM